mmetsp:Transcript_32532/g.85465  ORF Transcript_32532/g.85465 Transcript_32532/m.85465 type:complete len:220 (+) Transcript_32532:1404-2063(+)
MLTMSHKHTPDRTQCRFTLRLFSESARGRRANRARATRHVGKLACGPSQPAQQQLPDAMRRSPNAFRAPKLASSQLPAKSLPSGPAVGQQHAREQVASISLHAMRHTPGTGDGEREFLRHLVLFSPLVAGFRPDAICLPITAVEVVQVVQVVLPWLRPLCEQGEKMLEVKGAPTEAYSPLPLLPHRGFTFSQVSCFSILISYHTGAAATPYSRRGTVAG